MAKPGLEAGAKDAKAELRTFLLANEGLELYSNGVAATEDYLAKNPDVVKRFVRAAMQGWKFALANRFDLDGLHLGFRQLDAVGRGRGGST